MSNSQSKYWSYFIKKISSLKVNDHLIVNDWWRDGLNGASYTTIAHYISLLHNIGYLIRYSPGQYRIAKEIPKTLRY